MMIRRAARLLLVVGVVGVAACAGSAKPARPAKAPQTVLANWRTFARVHGPVDLAGPRSDRSLVLAAAGRLHLMTPSGAITSFASGYRGGGGEPYIALPAPGHRGCSFGKAVYALKLAAPHGVLAVSAGGRVRHVATLAASGLEDGIAFDEAGRFGHRLLVTVTASSRTTVYAINCRGRVSTLTTKAPRVEGGIAVAPASFGAFGGDLIAPDELSGRIYAITPAGRSILIATSDLSHGQDVGVESEVFVPHDRRFRLLLADRRTPGNPHPGDDLILALTSSQLRSVGVRAGDLLLATEGGAKVDEVRCRSNGCSVRHVADGPSIAHAEGHIAILPG